MLRFGLSGSLFSIGLFQRALEFRDEVPKALERRAAGCVRKIEGEGRVFFVWLFGTRYWESPVDSAGGDNPFDNFIETLLRRGSVRVEPKSEHDKLLAADAVEPITQVFGRQRQIMPQSIRPRPRQRGLADGTDACVLLA